MKLIPFLVLSLLSFGSPEFQPVAAIDQETVQEQYINFTLQNKSPKAIPLIIPGVMNPNLSPFSKSGVSLKIGQEILFKEKGKRQVLLTVDNSIKDGDILDIAQLLKERKRELESK